MAVPHYHTCLYVCSHIHYSGTLRGYAMKIGVKAICIEIGNPNAFMNDLIRMCYLGVARCVCAMWAIDYLFISVLISTWALAWSYEKYLPSCFVSYPDFFCGLILLCNRVINDLKMMDIPEAYIKEDRPDPVVCRKSYWIHTKTGGIYLYGCFVLVCLMGLWV